MGRRTSSHLFLVTSKYRKLSRRPYKDINPSPEQNIVPLSTSQVHAERFRRILLMSVYLVAAEKLKQIDQGITPISLP